MRNSTKKIVSSIVAFCMLFTTVFTNVVSATDHTAETLPGLALDVQTNGNVKTSTWSFTPAADATTSIYGGDTLEGLKIVGETTAKKSFKGGQLQISKAMGIQIPVSANVVSGTVTVTATGTDATRSLVLTNDASKSLEYTAGDVSLNFEASDVVDGHLDFTNTNSSGDYKMSKIVLVETLADGGAETTTEVVETTTEVVETSTEVTTNTVEESTEESTEAPVVNGKATLVANASAKEFTKVGETFTVTYDLKDNDGFNNVTGFIQYDAAVVKLTDMKVLGETVADATIIPNNSVGGYEYLGADNTLTAAELGNVKTSVIKGYPDNLENIVGEATLFELTFETVGAGSTAINFVPYGDFVDTDNNKVDVAITNTKVKVTLEEEVPAKEGKIAVTASKADFDVVPEEFTVDFAVTENPEFNNMTGFIEYDATVVELVSVADGLFAGFSTNAAEVPTNAVEGYEYLDANNTLTAAQLGKVKFAYTAATSGVPYDIKDTGSLFTATFKTVGKGTSAINLVLMENAKDSMNNVVKFDVTNTSVNVTADAPAEVEEIGLAVVPAGVEAVEGVYSYTFDGTANTIDVDYVITGNKSGIENVTFFAEFDPAVVTPVAVKDGDLKLNADLTYVPSATNEDYLVYGADGVKTVAELGAIKFVSEVAETAITTETIKVVTITYEVKKLDKTTLTAVPAVDADGHAVWGPAVNSLADRCRNVVVTNADIETVGKLGDFTYAVTLVDGATADENGNLVVAKDTQKITVSLDVKYNSGINAFTGFFDYDSTLLKPVSVKAGSTLISAEDVQNAMNYVPSATNEDFADLGSDGVKTAAELGRLSLANFLGEGEEFAEDGAIFVIEFERGEFGGETSIKFTDIQTSDADLATITSITKDLALVLEGEAVPQSKAHLLGDSKHDGVIDASDAAIVLSYAKNMQAAGSDVELDIANIDGSLSDAGAIVIDAKDAAYVLQKAKNQEYKFAAIEGGRTDITAEGAAEYIQVPADYEC